MFVHFESGIGKKYDIIIMGIDNMNKLQRKIRGSLLGGAIGDALGYQIEFKKNIKEKEITRFNDKGIISDDTQMTLFTANALIWRETRRSLRGIAMSPVDAIYLGYKDWLDTQNNTNGENSISWIKEIPELNIPRAPGNTCISALSSGKKGTVQDPINDSKGCGSIMRVAPIGLYIRNEIEAGKIAAEASALTHGHPLGIIPSYVFASMLNLIVNKDLDILNSLKQSIDGLLNNYNIFNKDDTKLFADLMNKAIELSSSDINDIDAINELGEGWVAEEALAIAVYSCLKYSDNFEDAIVCAINHDGDSDSTGSIAGNIIGAFLGEEAIPNYYLDNLELKDVIVEIADDLATPVPVSEYSNNNDEYWLSKYLYCHKDTSKKI